MNGLGRAKSAPQDNATLPAKCKVTERRVLFSGLVHPAREEAEVGEEPCGREEPRVDLVPELLRPLPRHLQLVKTTAWTEPHRVVQHADPEGGLVPRGRRVERLPLLPALGGASLVRPEVHHRLVGRVDEDFRRRLGRLLLLVGLVGHMSRVVDLHRLLLDVLPANPGLVDLWFSFAA